MRDLRVIALIGLLAIEMQSALGGASTSASTNFSEELRFRKVVLEDKCDDPMELCVAPDGRVLFLERGGQCIINGSIPERRSPRPAGEYGESLAAREMPDAENHNLLGYRDAGKNGSGDMARETIPSMGHEASLHMPRIFVGLGFRIFTNLCD